MALQATKLSFPYLFDNIVPNYRNVRLEQAKIVKFGPSFKATFSVLKSNEQLLTDSQCNG